MKDRRRAHRARLGVAVTITVGGKLIDAMGADVSPGGMRILADQALNEDDEVSLVFLLDGDIVSATGTVRWCLPARRGLVTFGVRFTAVDEDGSSLIANYCLSSIS